MDAELTRAQVSALEGVRSRSENSKEGAIARISSVAGEVSVDSLAEGFRGVGALTFNFHPDRLLADGRSVAAALYEEGEYRNQFETGISAGGLTAFPGGDRDRWEDRMFQGAYQEAGVSASERPKYGGLNVMNYSSGACARFGSCHLRLKPTSLAHATLSFGDSVTEPEDMGTADSPWLVIAALLEEVKHDGNALGRRDVDLATFLTALQSAASGRGGFTPTQNHYLDDYVEAQFHARIRLADDVDAVVLDPSFRGSASAELIEAAAGRYGFPVEWHPGYGLKAEEFGPDFRGPEVPPIARQIQQQFAGDREALDAATIGHAAVSVVTDADGWRRYGEPAETLQLIKYVWHTLVRYGRPGPERPGRELTELRK